MTQLNFRKVGMTDEAYKYPHSPYGAAIIAEHNGTTIDDMPGEFWYASNAYMHKWIETLGNWKAIGCEYRHITGRFLLPSELGI